jgi:hypothetical protein
MEIQVGFYDPMMKIVTAICAVFFLLSFQRATWDPHNKLWIVVRIAGDVGGTVGPLPYGMEECQYRAAHFMDYADPHVVTPQGYMVKDVSFTCEWHPRRPGFTGRWAH